MTQSNCWWACSGGDALIEPLSVVGGVLLRLGFPVELRGAAGDFAAVADRGPPVPVEAVAHPEIRREAVVEAAHDVPRVELPRLVARRVAGDVVRGARPIRMHHQRRDLGSHRTSQRIVARNDVARIGIAYRYAVDEASGGRIEDLTGENRTPERVDADLVASQDLAEVAALNASVGVVLPNPGSTPLRSLV